MMRQRENDLLERRYSFARESALRGSVESAENMLKSLSSYLSKQEIEHLITLACDIARERWYYESLCCVYECQLHHAARYLQYAAQYGERAQSPLDAVELQYMMCLAWNGSASRTAKVLFAARMLPLWMRTKFMQQT